MNKRLTVTGLALALALGGCERGDGHGDRGNTHANAADAATDTDALRRAEEAVLAAFRSGDAAAAAALYAEDATVMIANRPPAQGRAAIQALIAGDLEDRNFSIAFSGAEAHASGDLGYTRGSYTVTFTHPQTRQRASESGSYVTIFRRQADGSWKVAADISSPTAPAAAGQEAAGEGNSTAG